jgi:hypothetical protein
MSDPEKPVSPSQYLHSWLITGKTHEVDDGEKKISRVKIGRGGRAIINQSTSNTSVSRQKKCVRVWNDDDGHMFRGNVVFRSVIAA